MIVGLVEKVGKAWLALLSIEKYFKIIRTLVQQRLGACTNMGHAAHSVVLLWGAASTTNGNVTSKSTIGT
jgi:hypothetical protein